MVTFHIRRRLPRKGGNQWYKVHVDNRVVSTYCGAAPTEDDVAPSGKAEPCTVSRRVYDLDDLKALIYEGKIAEAASYEGHRVETLFLPCAECVTNRQRALLHLGQEGGAMMQVAKGG